MGWPGSIQGAADRKSFAESLVDRRFVRSSYSCKVCFHRGCYRCPHGRPLLRLSRRTDPQSHAVRSAGDLAEDLQLHCPSRGVSKAYLSPRSRLRRRDLCLVSRARSTGDPAQVRWFAGDLGCLPIPESLLRGRAQRSGLPLCPESFRSFRDLASGIRLHLARSSRLARRL